MRDEPRPSDDAAPVARAPLASLRGSSALQPWPVRRLVAAALLFAALLALQVAAGGGLPPDAAPGWIALVVAVAAASAVIPATYVPRPGSGWRLDVGCSPCAAVAPLSVLAATAVPSSAPHDVPTAILALAAGGFGLRQRLADPTICATANPLG